MKIIHCSDLHLDSRMETNLDSEKARQRREELFASYEGMVDYAEKEGARAILIAGDMFDRAHLRRAVRNRVLEPMESHPDIDFFYLRGNHDNSDFLAGLDEEEIPANLKIFTDKGWRSYEYGDLVISGAELSAENVRSMPARLELDPGKINIVMLHGQTQDYQGTNPAEEVLLPAYRGKGIDYLALGHIHSFRQGRLDERGIYCYSGCLEGRGFDECGPRGFVLIEISDGKLTSDFIPFARRQLHEIAVELAPEDSMLQVMSKSDRALRNIPEKDLVKLVFTGHISMDLELDTDRVLRRFVSRFFFIKAVDQTRTQIDFESYLNDRTIKGEFVRLMRKSDLSEEDKERVTRLGMKALIGEELEE